ncbi:MAG: hypothetical protein SOZ23_06715 [Methanosphaera sp.]|nr:hypothetical protein [Methanosphaera sp.]MCI5867750.1 hypothetical protein [Methanosphaera sp.]MDD6535291.1 hypothetical protein [Methanosphaera sp.]MDY3956452.1 hypothetical protein [Methanosphaera sp.]
MKLSDEFMDEAGNKKLAIITDILCVIFTLLVSVTNSDAACIFLSILIGTALASKVDSINHIISAILFIVILAIAGFPHFSLVCLVVCTIAAFVDEKGNDYSDKQIENNKGGFITTFFKYRYALKIAVLLFSLIGIVNMYLPGSMFCNFNFSAITFVDFLLFDLSYEFIGSHFNRINNFLN